MVLVNLLRSEALCLLIGRDLHEYSLVDHKFLDGEEEGEDIFDCGDCKGLNIFPFLILQGE